MTRLFDILDSSVFSRRTFSRRVEWLKKNRAFIAAPLLGTIIFVACVVFIINLNKIEQSNVVLSEGDAYHNRIVSLLEMYRSDTASLFRQQLTFVIENYLANQCWANFLDISNERVTTADNPQYENYDIERLGSMKGVSPVSQQTDFSMDELRYHKCKRVNNIIQQAAMGFYGCAPECSPPPRGHCDCTLAPPGKCDLVWCRQQDDDCKQCEARLAGLQKILRDLSSQMVFEGITFNSSNFDEFRFLFDDPGGVQANTFSRSLIVGSLFDCGAFAKSATLQCCSVSGDMFDEFQEGKPGYADRYDYDYRVECEDRDEPGHSINGEPVKPGDAFGVDGCGSGSFYVKIALMNSEVYPKMPRFHADDAVGNQLRTGSLGENDFLLPISYPFYKYLKQAFDFYEKVAYADKNAHDEGEYEGIQQGLCAASSPGGGVPSGDCSKIASYDDSGFPSSCDNAGTCTDEAKQIFVSSAGALGRACAEFTQSNRDSLVYLCTSDDGADGCSQDADSWKRICGDGSASNPDSPAGQDQDLYALYGSDLPTLVSQLEGGRDNYFTVNTDYCGGQSPPPANQLPQCAYFQTANLIFRLNDLNPENRVDPDNQNRFCGSIKIIHKKPA